jgi:DNA-directed RNA polymerase specialized sigma24 family protein
MNAHDITALQNDLLRIARGDQDVLQTANAKLWQHKDSIRDASRYAARLVRRECLSKIRRSSSTPRHVTLNAADEMPAGSASPLDALCAKEDRECLNRAVLRLPASQRLAIQHRLKGAIERKGKNHSADHKALHKLRQMLDANSTGSKSKFV